jgi:DNA-directed RNA polymerase specialized sigma subunit
VRLTSQGQHLVTQHLGLARAIAHRLRYLSPGRADDIHGDATVGLCYAAATHAQDGPVPFAAWAAVCIRSHVLQGHQKTKPHGYRNPKAKTRGPETTGGNTLSLCLSTVDGGESDVDWADLMDWWLGRLSDLQRRIVTGLYFDGRSLNDAPEWLGCSKTKANLQRKAALAILRDHLTA